MADGDKKSERSSSIQTNYSTPELLDLISESSSTINSTPRDDLNDDKEEDMSSVSTGSKTITTDITDTSSDFMTTTGTSETRLSTTTDGETKTTDTEYESTRRTYSDNSDSAYTNSQSNFTQTIGSVDGEGVKVEGVRSQGHNESSTQTPNTANLNVISNIQLSETTLNVIFNHVLKDVNGKEANSLNMSTMSAVLQDENKENEVDRDVDPKIINVQPVASFYLNRKEEIVVTSEHSKVIKYMISNVGAGSPYSKPAEVPQVIVPRYSALPRTSSMEVNTSSPDSTDRESDAISLVDSLEDGISPCRDRGNLLDHPGNGDDLSSLLPDNSGRPNQKSAVFFIPIENQPKEEFKPVSYHLPAKVKEKLSRRQLKRQLKLQQAKSNHTSPRSDSNYISASDNGNQISFTVSNNPDGVGVKSVPLLPEINNQKGRRKSKSILPSIQNVRKIKIDSKDNIKYSEFERIRPIRRRSQKIPEKLTPIYTSRNEYTCETMPKEIYRKTEFANANKRIEILEITECVGNKLKHHDFPKPGRSKIPILIQNKLPKIESPKSSIIPKPIYLDFDQIQNHDPKMDQLIANILIDTLNKYENPRSSTSSSTSPKINVDEKIPETTQYNNKYQQKFDAIPEESSRQSSLDDSSRNVLKNNTVQDKLYKNNNTNSDNSKSEDFPISASKLGDVLTIPQGWISFYMLHKNQGSPDSSTSDEGTKLKNNSRKDCCKNLNNKSGELPINKDKSRRDTLDTIVSSEAFSDNLNPALLAHTTNNEQSTYKNVNNNNNSNNSNSNNSRFTNRERCPTQGWSVTVSGINTYGQLAPDLEMRMKFPGPKENVDFSSQTKDVDVDNIGSNSSSYYETQEKSSCQLLKRHNHHNTMNSVADVATIDDNLRSGRLPVIEQNQNRKLSQQIDLNLTNSVVPFGYEPRQTKTSTRRYALNRHRTSPPTDANVTAENILSLSETETRMLAKLSEITVNGNSLRPERRCSNVWYANPR